MATQAPERPAVAPVRGSLRAHLRFDREEIPRLVGIIGAFNYLGLDRWVAGYLTPLGAYIRGDFRLFVLLLLGIISAIRLVVPISATIVSASKSSGT